MLICLVYFEVFQTLSSRILCLLCWYVFQEHYRTFFNNSHRIWGHSNVGMYKTSKVLFLHTFHVYQPHVGEDWYILDQHLEDIAFPSATQSWVKMEISVVSNDWICVQDEFPSIYTFSHLLVCSYFLLHHLHELSEGNESFLVISGHVVEIDLVQFVVYWLMYIIIGLGVWPGYSIGCTHWCLDLLVLAPFSQLVNLNKYARIQILIHHCMEWHVPL